MIVLWTLIPSMHVAAALCTLSPVVALRSTCAWPLRHLILLQVSGAMVMGSKWWLALEQRLVICYWRLCHCMTPTAITVFTKARSWANDTWIYKLNVLVLWIVSMSYGKSLQGMRTALKHTWKMVSRWHLSKSFDGEELLPFSARHLIQPSIH